MERHTDGHINGENGTDGANSNGIENPDTIEFVGPSLMVNKYKEYVRDHLAGNIRETVLWKILDKLETNEIILSFYDSLSLINDLQILENQYFRLNDELSFIPFIEAILKRTGNYAKNHTESMQGRANLNLLYTAILSKVCVVKNIEYQISPVELPEYLDLVLETNIDEYKNSLDRKIDFANIFIKFEILPDINNISNLMEKQISKSISKIINHKNETESDNDAIYDKMKKLENLINFYQMLNFLKTLSLFLEFYITVGTAVTEAIGGTSSIAESFLNRTQSAYSPLREYKLFGFVDTVNSSILLIQKTLINEPKLIFKQLEDIEYKLKSVSDEWVQPFLSTVSKIKSEITIILMGNAIFDPIAIDKMRIDLKDILLQNQTESKEGKIMRREVYNIISISNIATDLYEDIRSSKLKLELVANSINFAKDRYSIWKKGQEDIWEIIVSQLKEIQNSLTVLSEMLANRMHVELDRNWVQKGLSIQNALKNIKVVLRQMVKRTVLQPFMKHCTAKLDESIAMIINIFNRINSFSDKAKFNDYLSNQLAANHASEPFQSTNVSLDLFDIIHTNQVLEQYEVLMNLFRQYKFPFDHFDNPIFALPTDLKSNQTQMVKQKIIDIITHLKSNPKQISDISVENYDYDIFGNIDFNESNRSLSSPFFVWKNDEIQTEVERLLSGQEINLRADITDEININAVKFNQIGLRFILANERVHKMNLILCSKNSILE